jgi:hypothetical protein
MNTELNVTEVASRERSAFYLTRKDTRYIIIDLSIRDVYKSGLSMVEYYVTTMSTLIKCLEGPASRGIPWGRPFSGCLVVFTSQTSRL